MITRVNETISDMISALRLFEERFSEEAELTSTLSAEVSSGNTLFMSSALASDGKYVSLPEKSVLSLTESVFLTFAATDVSTLFLSDKALKEIAGEAVFSLAMREEFTSYNLYSDTEKSDEVTLLPFEENFIVAKFFPSLKAVADAKTKRAVLPLF